MTDKLIITGPIIHSPRPFEVEIIEKGYMIVDKNKITTLTSQNLVEPQPELKDTHYINLKANQFLVPGLIDTHIHAPQYPNAGLGYDKPLLEWLDTYTFPLEAEYNDLDFAKKVYNAIVKKTLDNGTTTASYFATLHVQASIALAEAAIKVGQRAFIGKVNMTKNCSNKLGEKDTAQSIQDTETFVKAVLDKKSNIVKPVITPRFALSVDMDLMKKLSDIATKYDLNIQSHICENKDEIGATLRQYPGIQTYSEVYDKAGLLTKKTIMAHGVHLTDIDRSIIHQRGTSIAHCPISNTSLQSGICDVRAITAAGITVGLGTDVAGGYSPSIIDVMRHALDSSIHLSYVKDNYQPFNYKDVFYLATLGGAKALAVEDKVGNFEIGKEFDALVVDMGRSKTQTDLFKSYTTAELLQKFIYVGDERNIAQVYVAGKRVKYLDYD